MLNSTYSSIQPKEEEITIVFFYYVEQYHCLPAYLEYTLRQAIISNSDSNIVLLSNINDCKDANDKSYWLWKNISDHIKIINTDTIISNKTKHYIKRTSDVSSSMFRKNDNDKNNPLWASASFRFFFIYDFMKKYNYTNAIHCESDTLLYSNMNSIRKQLLSISTLAATPLSWKSSTNLFTTASLFVINDMGSLDNLLNFFITLADYHHLVDYNRNLHFINNHTESPWFDYLKWLRRVSCCVKSRYLTDDRGLGIKPYSINEMSILTYFGIRNRLDLHYLPILPNSKGPIPRKSSYRYELRNYGDFNGFKGVFDPGTFGQMIAGSPHKKKGFVDTSHIASDILLRGTCRATFQCIKADESLLKLWNSSVFVFVPMLMCTGDDFQKTTLLHTMHIHSKNTENFISKECNI